MFDEGDNIVYTGTREHLEVGLPEETYYAMLDPDIPKTIWDIDYYEIDCMVELPNGDRIFCQLDFVEEA